jgi:nucleoside-diphosphate-sugar epimerase
MRILVTGSSGYIGSRFVKMALESSHEIMRTSRRYNSIDIGDSIYFDLYEDSPIFFPNNIDAVVHLAADTSNARDLPSDFEVKAAEILLNAANNIRAKFLFVSSQTADINSPTGYGKTKWIIEQKVLSNGGIVVRPGMVYGGPLRGLFGSLGRVISFLPFLPQFYPSPKVQLIHVDDLALCLLRIIENENINSRIFSLGEKEPALFNTFLYKISEIRFRSKKIKVLIPIFLINFFLSIPAFPNRAIWKKRFNSLLNLPNMNISDDLNVLNVNLRSLDDGMTLSTMPTRRTLLLEARALIKYILREDPSSALLIRYVRVLEALGDDSPIGLPSEFISFPFLISLISSADLNNSQMKEKFENRFNICSVLSESTLPGSRRFIRSGESSVAFVAVFKISYAILCELVCRILRLFFLPLIRFRLNQTKECV